MRVIIDIEMGKQRETSDLSTKCEGTPTTSTSASVSISELVGVSLLSLATTITGTTSVTFVSREFCRS